MPLQLSSKIPEEGVIEVVPIIELMKEFCDTPLDQSSISGAKTTEIPLYGLLKSIATGKNDEKDPFKLYILEHEGHFILLDLKQSPTGVQYAIYDSLSHGPNGQIRERRVGKILKDIFPGKALTHNKNQYIKVKQGENPHNVEDTDNCGLTCVFAQFIFEQFGEDFPINIFIQNPALYIRLNNIAQNLRGHQGVNIDEATQNLIILTLDILDSQEIVQQQILGMPSFDMSQEIEYLNKIDEKYSAEQEMDLLYDLTLQFQSFLSQAIKNTNQIDEKNLKSIAEIYKVIIQIFANNREPFLENLRDEYSGQVSGDQSGRKTLKRENNFTQHFVNALYFFYELKKKFIDKLGAKDRESLGPLGYFDPVLHLSQLVTDIVSVEKEAVGDRIDITILKDFDQAIALALRLAKENDEIYKQSARDGVKLLTTHLNNQLLHYRATRSLQGSGASAFIPRKSLSKILVSYAENVGKERNDHNIMGLLMDYAMNDTLNSRQQLKLTLSNIKNEEKKLQFLQVAIEMLAREASSPMKKLTQEKYSEINSAPRIDRFTRIYNLLTSEGLGKFVETDGNLKFALLFAKQNLYMQGQKEIYKTSEDEVLAIDPRSLSGIYSELYLSSISLTQDLAKATIVVMNHLESGVAPHRPSQEAVDLYNLQAAYGFRDYFTYNKSCLHFLTDDAFKAAKQIHEKAIEKMASPSLELGLLNSLFKLQYLSADNVGSKNTVGQMATLITENPNLDKEINLQKYLKYLEAPQDELDIEQRLELIKEIDPKINDLEQQAIIDSNHRLYSQQQLASLGKLQDKGAPALSKKSEKEYTLKIDGKKVDLDTLPSVNYKGKDYKIYCPDSVLAKSGDSRGCFEEALQKDKFAAATGEGGVKYLGKNKEGTNVYEIKITESESRILGIETEFRDQDGKEVKLICFSKYLKTTKDSSGRFNKACRDTKDNLTKPAISYKEKTKEDQEKDPGGSPSDTSGDPVAARGKEKQGGR